MTIFESHDRKMTGNRRIRLEVTPIGACAHIDRPHADRFFKRVTYSSVKRIRRLIGVPGVI